MFKRSKPIVAIEINPFFIRIMEAVCTAHEPRIINYVQIPSGSEDPEIITDKLNKTLKEKHITARDAYLAVCSPQIEHHLLQLPPLSKKEMQQAIREEVVGEDPKKIQEIYYDYYSFNAAESPKVNKKNVLMVSAPRQLINNYIEILQKSHLNPCQITSAPLTISSALALTESSQQNTTLVFLYLLPDRAYLTFISHGAWRFTRKILLMSYYQRPGSESASETPVEAVPQNMQLSLEAVDLKQILLEINRTILYFTQMQREARVERLIIATDRLVSQELIDILAEKLGLTVEMFDPCPKLDLSSLGDSAAEFQQRVSSMAIPIGLLGYGRTEIGINFLPLGMRERKKRLASRLLITLAIMGYFLLLIGGYWGLWWVRNNLRQSLAAQQQSLQGAQPLVEEAQKAQRERQEHELVLSVLKSFEHSAPLWRGVLYELSHLLPSGVILSSFPVEEKKGRWQWQTRGRIEAGDSVECQAILVRFLTNLEQSVFFVEPNIRSLSIGPGPGLNSQLNFELSCLIRY